MSIITNGTLLTLDRFMELRDAGVCEIQISAQTLSKDHYQSEMKGADFDRLMDNLSNICRADRSNVRIRFNSIMDLTESEKCVILKYCEVNGFIPFLRTKHSRGGTIFADPIDRSGCGIFASTTFVNFKGEILRCVNDRFGTPIGNIHTDSFQKIIEKKREIIQTRDIADSCKVCSDSYRWEILDSMNVHIVKKSGSDP